MGTVSIREVETLFDGVWFPVRDGDPRVRDMLNRHYSAIRYRDGRRPLKAVGPGEYMLLMTIDSRAVFAWVRNTVERRDKQDGIYCSLFRNEGPCLSSDLIREACSMAWRRWPGQRLFTYVDAAQVQSTNPGYCFLCAGWSKAGASKNGKLLMELRPWQEGGINDATEIEPRYVDSEPGTGLAVEDRERTRAILLGQADWGRHGSASEHHRYIQPVRTRNRCRCGCRGRVTHMGMANGVALMSGCAMSVYRWRQSQQVQPGTLIDVGDRADVELDE